ncbi:MAG: hypothetical protein J0M26_28475, partial [Planctomycetes bacterium]|nr:hypothetical protein [Planctomycetota bacterium]
LILGTYPRTITGMFSGVWVLTSILIRLLMSIQVLLCPALCVGTCATHERFSQVESVATCGCCSDVCASTPLENGPAAPPCDPCSDSCNCFCGGAVTSQVDEISAVDAVGQLVAPLDPQLRMAPQAIVSSHEKCHEDGTKLFGRGLLRAYCVLLI